MVGVKAVIVGAGAAGVLHALAFRAEGVRVVGVYDPDAERASSLAAVCDAQIFPSIDRLRDCDAEIASVCSPPVAHVAQAGALAASGRTVFVEKPIATSLADLWKIEALGGCVPILPWRKGRGPLALREALRMGAFGPAPLATAELIWGRDEAYFAARADRAAWGCGALLSVGVHAVDALCWAIDRPVRRAQGSLGHRPPVEVETRAAIHVAFEGGAIAVVSVTFDAPVEETTIRVVGGDTMAVLRGPTESAVAWTTRDEAQRNRLVALENGIQAATAHPLLVPFLADAVRALRDGARPGSCEALPSIAETRPAHEAILRVYEEARAAPG